MVRGDVLRQASGVLAVAGTSPPHACRARRLARKQRGIHLPPSHSLQSQEAYKHEHYIYIYLVSATSHLHLARVLGPELHSVAAAAHPHHVALDGIHQLPRGAPGSKQNQIYYIIQLIYIYHQIITLVKHPHHVALHRVHQLPRGTTGDNMRYLLCNCAFSRLFIKIYWTRNTPTPRCAARHH